MANNADWRNLQQTHVNAVSSTNNDLGASMNSRSKKFDNLSSNIFGQEEKDNQ